MEPTELSMFRQMLFGETESVRSEAMGELTELAREGNLTRTARRIKGQLQSGNPIRGSDQHRSDLFTRFVEPHVTR